MAGLLANINHRRTHGEDVVDFTGMVQRARKLHKKVDDLNLHRVKGATPVVPAFTAFLLMGWSMACSMLCSIIIEMFFINDSVTNHKASFGLSFD